MTIARRAARVLGAVMIAAAATVLTGCGGGDGEAAPRGRTARYCAIQDRFAGLDLLDDAAPAAVRSDLRDLLTLTRRAARQAPAGIRADAEAAVVAQERFNALYAAHGWDPDATNRDREFIAFANSPELGALYLRLEAYQSRECGPDPRSTGPDVA